MRKSDDELANKFYRDLVGKAKTDWPLTIVSVWSGICIAFALYKYFTF